MIRHISQLKYNLPTNLRKHPADRFFQNNLLPVLNSFVYPFDAGKVFTAYANTWIAIMKLRPILILPVVIVM